MKPCRFNIDCKNPKCKFLHPCEWKYYLRENLQCPDGSNCKTPKCNFQHPQQLSISCSHGIHCKLPNCYYNHPEGWAPNANPWGFKSAGILPIRLSPSGDIQVLVPYEKSPKRSGLHVLGGKREANETPILTAVRECYEEMNKLICQKKLHAWTTRVVKKVYIPPGKFMLYLTFVDDESIMNLPEAYHALQDKQIESHTLSLHWVSWDKLSMKGDGNSINHDLNVDNDENLALKPTPFLLQICNNEKVKKMVQGIMKHHRIKSLNKQLSNVL